MREEEYHAVCKRIKLFVLDVDGTLTDGSLYYNHDGEIMKRFHVRDGLGIVLLKHANIEVALMTRENSPIAESRARKLGIPCFTEVIDKGIYIQDLAAQRGLTSESVGFMGDDIIDIPPMLWAGFTACPADAHPEVRAYAMYVSSEKGGNGAVRDVCDLILRSQGKKCSDFLPGLSMSNQEKKGIQKF